MGIWLGFWIWYVVDTIQVCLSNAKSYYESVSLLMIIFFFINHYHSKTNRPCSFLQLNSAHSFLSYDWSPVALTALLWTSLLCYLQVVLTCLLFQCLFLNIYWNGVGKLSFFFVRCGYCLSGSKIHCMCRMQLFWFEHLIRLYLFYAKTLLANLFQSWNFSCSFHLAASWHRVQHHNPAS